MKLKRNWFGLLSIFISICVFISLIIVISRYGVTTAFFKFNNPDGAAEKILNVGMFWIIALYSMDRFIEGIDEIKGKRRSN